MSTKVKVLIGAVVLVLVAAGGFLWWFFKDDAPDPVSLDTAVESVSPSTTVADADDPVTTDDADETTTTTEAAADGVEGTWSVDTESGDFDFETATGTFAGFRIQEELSAIGSATAVGRTGDVSGSITIEGTTVTEATFEVDLTTITTNESRRDDRVQQALETGQFPTGTFTLTEPIELGDAAAGGEPVSVTAVGELTLHGVTQPIQLAVDAQLVNGTIVLVGTTDIVFSDYGVETPQSPAVLSVEDHGVLEMQILLVR